jgi:hypothetical protein
VSTAAKLAFEQALASHDLQAPINACGTRLYIAFFFGPRHLELMVVFPWGDSGVVCG